MRFQHILHALHFQPWLILDTAHTSLVQLIESKLAGDATAAGSDLFGDPLPQMTIADGIAEIPISGPIGKGLGNLEKSCGACSIDDVQRNIAEATSRPDVRGILLSIGSPGGSITGIPETANMIARAREKKPVVAFTDGMMASAAYWLASQANEIIATKSAQVGSIGVYIPWQDSSRRAEAMGIKTGVVKNKEGTFKGMGFPGTAYTAEQMAHLQERADELFGMFKSDVVAMRKRVRPEAMQGQTLFGDSAHAAGLVDSVDTHLNAWSRAYSLSQVGPVASVHSGSSPTTGYDARAEWARLQKSGDARAAGKFYAAHRDLILSRF